MLTVRQLIAHLQNMQQDIPVKMKVYACGQEQWDDPHIEDFREIEDQSHGGVIMEIDAAVN